MANKPISVTIKGDYTDRDVKRAIRDLESLQTQAPKTTKAMGGLNKAMLGFAAGISAGAVVRGIQSTITAASDLAESQSKVRVVFGQSARSIEDWSKTSATSMLMTQQAALEAAGTYGNLFQAFGIGQTKATEMSKTLVDLAADLASFNNSSTEDAITAIRSGLSGETEPLKRYGVALTDARLKQEALNMGIYNGKGILDAAQKSQAAYALILKDTVLAQGDVERTADGYANTMRAVEAAVGNAQAAIGEELLMSIQEVSKSLGGAKGLVSLIDELGATLVDVIRPARDFFAVFAEGNRDLEAATGFSLDFANAIRNGIGFVLGPTTGLLYKYSDAAQEADEKSTSLVRTFVTARDNFTQLAIDAGLIDREMQVMGAGVETATIKINKQTTAVDRLRASMDKLDGRRSIARQRIQLKRMLAEGPTATGERTVMKDGKEVTERFVTRQDKRLFALDVADARAGLGEDIYAQGNGSDAARRKARRQFSLGRGNIRDLGFGQGYASGILGTPDELLAGTTNQQRLVAGQTGQNVREVNYNFYGDMLVKDLADAAEQQKRNVRLNAINAGRNGGARAALVD